MTVSECPQCVPPEKLSMQCQHRRVSRDQEDSGDSLRDLWGEVSSPLLARFGRFKSRRGQSSKTAAWNRELLSLALTGSSFSDSFSTLFKYSPLRNWGRAESSLNKLKQYSSSYLTKSQCCTLGQSSDILTSPHLYIDILELEKILLSSASWQGGAPSLCWCPPIHHRERDPNQQVTITLLWSCLFRYPGVNHLCHKTRKHQRRMLWGGISFCKTHVTILSSIGFTDWGSRISILYGKHKREKKARSPVSL